MVSRLGTGLLIGVVGGGVSTPSADGILWPMPQSIPTQFASLGITKVSPRHSIS